MIHPVSALSRLRPSLLQVGTLIAAHLTSTTAAAAFGFVAVLGLRELLHAILGTTSFRRISVVVRAGLVVALVTTLLLIPAMSFRVADAVAAWRHQDEPVAADVASSYVPTVDVTTYGGVYAFLFLIGVYTVAWLERLALGTTRGAVALFVVTGAILAVIRGMDVWQRRDRVEVELDELVEPPTLRLGLTE